MKNERKISILLVYTNIPYKHFGGHQETRTNYTGTVYIGTLNGKLYFF